MAKVDDPKLPGWDEPPLPLNPGETAKRPAFRQLSLIAIMIGVVYFAILFWALKQVYDLDSYASYVLFSVVIGLGLCGVGLWGALKLARFAVIGWITFIIGYMTITISTTNALAIPTLPILIGAIIFLSIRRHANNQEALLWVLEVAAARGIPLAPGVQAFSSQVSGMYQIWAAGLADLLRRGVPLPDALDKLRRLVPRRAALMVRSGWEAGDLSLGLQEAGASRETRQPILHAIGGRIAYLGWIVTISFFIVSFVCLYIIPRFEAIFRDFGMTLPEVTVLVIRASHLVIDYFWVGTLAFLAALIYGLVALLGPGDLTIPIFDRLFARRHTITILRALAVVVGAARPIPPALYSLAQCYPASWVRRRLAHAAADASQGVEWTEALRINGLISASDLGVLASAERAGNLAWALRELAETGERRWAYRLQAWSQILFVITMLVLGTMMLLLAVSFFMPLVALIERLS